MWSQITETDSNAVCRFPSYFTLFNRLLIPTVHAGEISSNDGVKEKECTLYEPLPGETGWQRIKMLFVPDDWGQRHPDLDFVLHGTIVAGLTGLFIGGYIGSRQSVEDFISKNEATRFYNELDAKRRLNDHVMLGTFKHSFKLAWRLSLFTGMYLFTATLITNYRNKPSIFDYIGAGCVTGSLYKFYLGPRAMFVGGLAGGVLGSIAGTSIAVLLWMSGTSLEQMNYWRTQYKVKQESEVYGFHLESREKNVDVLRKSHSEAPTN